MQTCASVCLTHDTPASVGDRTTDGRSIVPLLQASNGGRWPDGIRGGGLLVEHLGENNQWMTVCDYVFNATPCPPHPAARDAAYLIDGPQVRLCVLSLNKAGP